ncbi:hypothetical protein [Neptunicella sp.]|uniref:hypothetical protein n=1 Tax=Neptunicella sp. TaxID=2125986 RepID=UPI003F68FC30
MKWLSLCFSLCLLSACSATRVIVNQRYLSDDQTSQIVSTLNEAGFDVLTNDYEFPAAIQQSTLMYALVLNDPNTIDEVQLRLATLGWNINSVQPLVTGNQWFSNNSLGLFLIPDNINRQQRDQVSSLLRQFHTDDCTPTGSIKLTADQHYQMSFDQPLSAEQQASLTGIWRVTEYPYIELRSQDRQWWFYLVVEQQTRADSIGRIKVTSITPVEDYFFGGCTFSAGVRE